MPAKGAATMGAWGRWRSRLRSTQAAIGRLRPAHEDERDANLLAVSDLHLGYDLKRDAGPGVQALRAGTSGPSGLDLQLGAMLDHYAPLRPGGRPWRLVLAGDIVDFIAINRTPEPDEAVPFRVSAEERLYGLQPEPPKAVWKLERTMDRHALLMQRLAAFVSAGHEIAVIRGNHDAEWYFPEVQHAFRERLAALAPRAKGLRERVRFFDWFYLEPGRVFIEHGHLHDEYSAFDDALRPIEAGNPQLMREPLSTLALRYFGNAHQSVLDTNDVEHWGVFDFVRWAVRSGRLRTIVADYLRMTGRVFAYSAKASARSLWSGLRTLARLGRDLADARDEKLARVRQVLRDFRADQEDLALGLVSLVRRPAERSLLSAAQMLYVDRLALGAGVVGAGAGAATFGGTPLMRAGLVAAVLAVAALVNLALRRTRGLETHPKLLAGAHRVALVTGVPLIVMGHSHKAVDREVGAGSRYVNLGTWVSAHKAAPGRKLGLPHLVVTDEGAELRRWGGETGVEKLQSA